MKKIAFYGKGGIGKSTVTSNLSAALAVLGYRVMQIGCDPKADSTLTLTGGIPPVPVISYLREHGVCNSLDDIVTIGYGGTVCVESGGPTPGIGCAGRGIISAFNALEDLDAFNVYKPDFVLFDVLGDVVCGGFTMPLREGWADEVVLVTSGEKMSLYAARNIAAALDTLSERGYAVLKGIIGNLRNIPGEKDILRDFSRALDTNILGFVPRHDDIQRWEEEEKTVVQGAPDSEVARVFFDIAESVSADVITLGDKGGEK